MTPSEVVRTFFERVAARDVEGALGLVAPGASIQLHPLGGAGRMDMEGCRYLEALATAFPDLQLRVRRLFVATDGTAAAEITVEGTQAADFLGIVNQEKHMDLDQAWLLHLSVGRIDRVTAYWCQNQLYRRLAVKRLDRVTITA